MLPAQSLLDSFVESLAAGAPIKPGVAIFVSTLLEGIEPLDVVDYGNNALREFPHRFKGQIMQPGRQRQSGHATSYRGNRQAIENIIE